MGPGCGSAGQVASPGCGPRLWAPVAVWVLFGWLGGLLSGIVLPVLVSCLFPGMTSGPQVWGPAIPPPCSPTVQVPGPFRGPEVPGPGSGGPVPWPVPGPGSGGPVPGSGSGARFQAPVRGFSEWEGFWVGVPTSSTVNLLQALSVSSSHSESTGGFMRGPDPGPGSGTQTPGPAPQTLPLNPKYPKLSGFC